MAKLKISFMNFPNDDNNSELFMSDKKIILIKKSCNIKKYYIYIIICNKILALTIKLIIIITLLTNKNGAYRA
jgi:hypothetical protein